MPPKDAAKAEIENRFTFHPATEETGPKHDAVRADFKRMALKMHKDLPDGRHKSLVLTALEEAMHWANAAIACNGASPAAPAPRPEPTEQGTDVKVPPAAKRRAKAVEAGGKSPRRVARRSKG